MPRILPRSFVVLALASPLAWAAEAPIVLTPAQIQSMGLALAPLAGPRDAAGATLPAQVQVPHNQLQAVAAPFAGQVLQLGAAVGEKVKKGQLLARIASPALLALQRDYLQSANQAQLAGQIAKRDEQLWREGIIAESRWQASRSAGQQAGMAAHERRQALRLAGVPDQSVSSLSGQVDVLAPLDGEVLEQSVAVGQRLEQGAPLFRIGRLAPLWLEIQAPVQLAASLRPGATVQVSGVAAQGKVITIGRQLSGASQTLPVRALINQGAELLHPGQFVEAGLALESAAGAGNSWQVPSAAIARHRDKNWIFVLRPAGKEPTSTFIPVETRVTGQSGAHSQVAAAKAGELRGGDQVAVKGVSALKASWMGIGKD